VSKIIIIIISIFLYCKSLIAMDFLDCIQDIPIHNKIIEIKDSCFLFDSDTGKIVSVEASSLLSNMEVLEFYKTILLQFGWDLKSENNNEAIVFIRENEILKININKANNILFSSFLSLKNN
tara:strand:- start:566 stop:931 length:366 start_codon:yes stop_codon:yes gene_type:complete